MNETPSASSVAAEIHRNFKRKMAKGGEIDRILNGGEPIEKQAPETDDEIALRKKQIEIQLREYEAALVAAAEWHHDWLGRQRASGFRCVQDQPNESA